MVLSSERPYVSLQRDRLMLCSSASNARLLVDGASSVEGSVAVVTLAVFMSILLT